MKMKKWFAGSIAAILIASLAIPITAQGAVSGSANDATGHWAQKSIQRWTDNGVIKGYSDGSFQPDKSMTRAEFAAMVNGIFGYYAESQQSFSDVPVSAWYAKTLSIAKQAGYYKGFPNNLSQADTSISRQDAAVLLAIAFKLKASSSDQLTFADSNKIAAYAKDAVNALASIVSGYPDHTFRPNDSITRAEVVTLIDKLAVGYYSSANRGTEGLGEMKGNVIINHTDVQLKDTIIAGNLYFAPGIADGEAALEGATVKGTTFIEGGGKNTIIIDSSKLGQLEVNRREGEVRVLIQGNSQVGSIVVQSAAVVQLEDNAIIDNLILNGPAVIIMGKGTIIRSLTVQPAAKGASVTGNGSITAADIQAAEFTVNGKTISVGAIAVKDGVVVAAPSGAGGSSGSGTGNNGGGNGGGGEEMPTIDLADVDATVQTKSLFAYLQGTRGEGILFGHQHATTEGISITAKDGTQSDVNNGVGAFPALFGWDTLSLEGREKPGLQTNSKEQNTAALAGVMKKAYDLGGTITLSAHMPNFVTGGYYNDTKGNVVSHILPGGNKNDVFNAYLDQIADLAHALKDNQGNAIPIIFRPFHENNGGWFWWGAQHTSSDQYIEIYRYTVEYLRDKKDVHNFLYAYSPNGLFNGSDTIYMKTYPGDDYVDILGYDLYDSTEGSEGWLNGLVQDAAMISKLADAKGKIAAFTEFGYSTSGMHQGGNGDPQWFTHVLNALKSDPDAKRMAYMQTWANFGSGQVFVPYPATDTLPEHELMADFRNYYSDPYSYFNTDLVNVYSRIANTSKEKPFLHLVTPSDTGKVTTATTKIRVRITALSEAPTGVVYTVGDSAAEHALLLDSDGYYSAEWSPSADTNGGSTTIKVKARLADGKVLEDSTTFNIAVSEILVKEYAFDASTEGVQNNGGWQAELTSLEQTTMEGNGYLKLNAVIADPAHTWQELKLQLPTVIDSVYLPDVQRVKLDLLIPVAGNESASLQAVAMLPPNWDDKYGMNQTNVKLSDLNKVTISEVEYGHYSAVIELNNADELAKAEGMAISIIGSGMSYTGPIYVDRIQLLNVYTEPVIDPTLVDDFESYQGENSLLESAYSPQGDPNSISLTTVNTGSGLYALKLDYNLASQGYTGISKNMNDADWSANNHLKLWLVPDASNQKLVIQIQANGIYFEAYPSLAGAEAGWLEIPFSQFATAGWDTGNTGAKLNATNAKHIQAFSIYVNKVEAGLSDSGSLYIDDIHAIDDGTGNGGGDGGGTTPVAPGILYDFESDNEGWIINSDNNTAAASALLSTDDAATGSGSMRTDFTLGQTTNGAGAIVGKSFELFTETVGDLSQLNTISVKIKLAPGADVGDNVQAVLYMKTGTGWTWNASSSVALASDQYVTISLPLDGLADLNMVRAIGVQVTSAVNGSGSATVYADSITAE
ncbi:MAG: glycosyl hydrolase [Candidatus Pristimantibacillus sp.]